MDPKQEPFSCPDALNVVVQIFGENHNFTFDADMIVSKIVVGIANAGVRIQNPEAFGLCFADDKDEKSSKKKKKAKDGAFRDTTRWLDENHSLRFYVTKGFFQDNGILVFKVKNTHLCKTKAVYIVIPSLGAEVLLKYNYMTTVESAIRKMLDLEEEEALDKEWVLLLPIGRDDSSKMLSLLMDPTRTLQSYNLQAAPPTAEKRDGDHYRILVLTKDPKELNSLANKIFEDELELWWIIQIQKDNWPKFRPNVNYKKFEKLKGQVRKGVPGVLRGDIWPILTGAREMAVPGEYATYRSMPLPPDVDDRIRRDLHRTLPFHPYFQTEQGRDQLFLVLAAYCNKEPEISYCQGMNFIVGVLLLTMNEEGAYWCFNALMSVYGMREFFGDNVPLLSSSLIQFQRCIETMNPNIWEHFEAECINLSLFATPWFLTLFAYDAQLEFLHRLWDIFFNEGFSIIFRTAMAILREGQDLIINYDMQQMKEYFQYAPRQITEPDLILNAAFKVPKSKFMHKVYTKAELIAIEGGGKDGKSVTKEQARSGMYHAASIERSSISKEYPSAVVHNGTVLNLKAKSPNGLVKEKSKNTPEKKISTGAKKPQVEPKTTIVKTIVDEPTFLFPSKKPQMEPSTNAGKRIADEPISKKPLTDSSSPPTKNHEESLSSKKAVADVPLASPKQHQDEPLQAPRKPVSESPLSRSYSENPKRTQLTDSRKNVEPSVKTPLSEPAPKVTQADDPLPNDSPTTRKHNIDENVLSTSNKRAAVDITSSFKRSFTELPPRTTADPPRRPVALAGERKTTDESSERVERTLPRLLHQRAEELSRADSPKKEKQLVNSSNSDSNIAPDEREVSIPEMKIRYVSLQDESRSPSDAVSSPTTPRRKRFDNTTESATKISQMRLDVEIMPSRKPRNDDLPMQRSSSSSQIPEKIDRSKLTGSYPDGRIRIPSSEKANQIQSPTKSKHNQGVPVAIPKRQRAPLIDNETSVSPLSSSPPSIGSPIQSLSPRKVSEPANSSAIQSGNYPITPRSAANFNVVKFTERSQKSILDGETFTQPQITKPKRYRAPLPDPNGYDSPPSASEMDAGEEPTTPRQTENHGLAALSMLSDDEMQELLSQDIKEAEIVKTPTKPPSLPIGEVLNQQTRSRNRKSDKRSKIKVKKSEAEISSEEGRQERSRSSSGGKRQKSPRKYSPASVSPSPRENPPAPQTNISFSRSKSTTKPTGVRREPAPLPPPEEQFSYRPGVPFNFPSMPPIPQTPAFKLEPDIIARPLDDNQKPTTPQEVRRIFEERARVRRTRRSQSVDSTWNSAPKKFGS